LGCTRTAGTRRACARPPPKLFVPRVRETETLKKGKNRKRKKGGEGEKLKRQKGAFMMMRIGRPGRPEKETRVKTGMKRKRMGKSEAEDKGASENLRKPNTTGNTRA